MIWEGVGLIVCVLHLEYNFAKKVGGTLLHLTYWRPFCGLFLIPYASIFELLTLKSRKRFKAMYLD